MSLPRTLGELQLYRVLQRANLLVYYDTFIQQGGDDVQQLCEAGEEEFLEIMALVGMATKPLHVRRLQKALRDWASNPAQFNQPLGANTVTSGIPLLRIDGANSPGTQKPLNNGRPSPQCDREEQRSCHTPLRNNSPKSPSSQESPAPQDHLYRDKLSSMEPHWLSPEIYRAVEMDEECSISPLSFDCHSRLAPSTSTASSFSAATSSWLGGQLDPDTIRVMEESVNRLLRTFPHAEPGEVRALLRLNKKLSKTVGHIFNMEPQDKSKDEEIRKYSLIYGRFDSKRREGKQLTHHEMLINEAAAQICIRDNGLLLRRVELFSLARQVARECAYTSTFKHNRTNLHDFSAHDCSSQKRMRLDVTDRTSNDSAGLSSDIRSTADENSLSGESLDSSTQDISPHFPSSSLHPLPDSTGLITWSRQLMQQTLMDEGLRLARMVSCDHGSRVSLVSEKIRVPETEETVSDRNAQHS